MLIRRPKDYKSCANRVRPLFHL